MARRNERGLLAVADLKLGAVAIELIGLTRRLLAENLIVAVVAAQGRAGTLRLSRGNESRLVRIANLNAATVTTPLVHLAISSAAGACDRIAMGGVDAAGFAFKLVLAGGTDFQLGTGTLVLTRCTDRGLAPLYDRPSRTQLGGGTGSIDVKGRAPQVAALKLCPLAAGFPCRANRSRALRHFGATTGQSTAVLSQLTQRLRLTRLNNIVAQAFGTALLQYAVVAAPLPDLAGSQATGSLDHVVAVARRFAELKG